MACEFADFFSRGFFSRGFFWRGGLRDIVILQTQSSCEGFFERSARAVKVAVIDGIRTDSSSSAGTNSGANSRARARALSPLLLILHRTPTLTSNAQLLGGAINNLSSWQCHQQHTQNNEQLQQPHALLEWCRAGGHGHTCRTFDVC
jgi:hypothetical protein